MSSSPCIIEIADRPFEPSVTALARIHDSIESYPTIDAMSAAFPFRSFASSEIPEISRLAESIRVHLDGNEGSVLLPHVLNPSSDSKVMRFLLLTIADCIGTLSITDYKNKKIIWEVTPAKEYPEGHKRTISENNEVAELHTDSVYRHNPERYVALFCVHRADDGGGTTKLLDAETILRKLRELPNGPESEQLLRTHEFPMRVPDSFTAIQNSGQPEVIKSTVLSDSPQVRFRYDSIIEGLSIMGEESIGEDAMHALDTFRIAVSLCAPDLVTLESGDLLLVNNHRLIHGRTGFIDSKRLLLRVRMHQREESV